MTIDDSGSHGGGEAKACLDPCFFLFFVLFYTVFSLCTVCGDGRGA